MLVTIKIVTPDPPDDAWEWETMLGLRRLDDGWHLCFGVGPVDVTEYWEHPWRWKPISQCTPEERKEAALALPKLLKEVARKAEDSEIGEALATLKQVLDKLRQASQKRREQSSGSAEDAP